MSAHIQFLRQLIGADVELEWDDHFVAVRNEAEDIAMEVEPEQQQDMGQQDMGNEEAAIMEVEDTVDDGLEADAPDEEQEMAFQSRYLDIANLEDIYYCSTVAFAVIATEERDVYICERCYIPYSIMAGSGSHRHVSVHLTTTMGQIPSFICKACNCWLQVVSRVESCTYCNNVEKLTHSLNKLTLS